MVWTYLFRGPLDHQVVPRHGFQERNCLGTVRIDHLDEFAIRVLIVE